jgi:hypothetical protein
MPPATLERHDGPVVVERITGQARSTGVAIADDQGTRFQLRFVPELIIDRSSIGEIGGLEPGLATDGVDAGDRVRSPFGHDRSRRSRRRVRPGRARWHGRYRPWRR